MLYSMLEILDQIILLKDFLVIFSHLIEINHSLLKLFVLLIHMLLNYHLHKNHLIIMGKLLIILILILLLFELMNLKLFLIFYSLLLNFLNLLHYNLLKNLILYFQINCDFFLLYDEFFFVEFSSFFKRKLSPVIVGLITF